MLRRSRAERTNSTSPAGLRLGLAVVSSLFLLIAPTAASAQQFPNATVIGTPLGAPFSARRFATGSSAAGVANSSADMAGATEPLTGIEPALPLPAGSQITLKQAIEIALRDHPLVAEAAAQTGAAQEQVGEARSYLGPQLYGVSQYLRSTDNGIGNTSYYNPDGVLPRMTGRNHDLPSSDFSQSWDTSNNYTGGLALSQYLLDFGRRRGFVAERRFEAAAAGEQQALINLDLIFEVSQRYFNLLEAKTTGAGLPEGCRGAQIPSARSAS